jgi:integrase
MSDEIKVTVIKYPDRENLVLAYIDPVSGKRKTRSAKTANEKKAWQEAAKWEEELRGGAYCPPSKVTWADFRKKYEDEHLATLAPHTQEKARYALDRIERYLSPDRLCKLTAGALSAFQKKVRDTGAKDTTIAAMLRHVKAALRWGASVGMVAKVPSITMPKRSKGRKMKGGALVGEQFDRMLAAVPKVRPHDAPEWQRYLNGLWLSGLRLGESVALSWDAIAPFAIDLSGKRPKFRIRGEAQKSGQDELLPMVPDFAEFILQTPENERRGRVFKLNDVDTGNPIVPHWVGKLVAQIGKTARIVVNPADGKTASAHDLRRTFGTRWAKKVMPAVLRKLMRHASVETTMGYYVDLNVDEMADDLWANHQRGNPAAGNKSGNIGPVDAPTIQDGVDASNDK